MPVAPPPPPPCTLPFPHFTLPPLAGEDHLFVSALRSHLSASPAPTAASLSRFVPGLTPLRLSHLGVLLAVAGRVSRLPHSLLTALLPSPPPPLPLAILLHSLPPRRCSELLASVLPSVSSSPRAFPDLLHHVILTARLAAASAVPAVDVLFSACARDKKLSRATLTYRAMRAHGLLPAVESCNVFISAALRLRRPEIAVSFFREMRRCRVSPNVYTVNMVMRANCALGRVADAAQLLDEMPGWGFGRTAASFNTLIAAYCHDSGGGMETALRLKERMEREGLVPNEVTYNTIVHGLCKEGRMQQASRVVSEMRVKGVTPNTITFNTLIHGYVTLGDNEAAMRMHEEMVKVRVGADMVTYNALILGLCNQGKTTKARKLVQELCAAKLEPNASTFSALIIGQCKKQNSERALDLLNAMKKAGFQPNHYTYKIVVSTFSKNKDFEGAVEVLKDMLRRCISPDKALLHEFFQGLSDAKKLHLAADLRSVPNGARFISDVYYTGDYRNEEKITC